MNNATLLIVEGRHADYPAFASALSKRGFKVDLVFSGNEALIYLNRPTDPDVVVVNAATLRTSGKRICYSLREKVKNLPILLILDPEREVANVKADVVLSLPFTAQKLVNRIRHLLPSDDKNIYHVGPIRLDVQNRSVRCLAKKSRLTPRLVRLLKILLDHHGEVIERNKLFSKVWETNYTGDTRTLDVHISWLRQAIETDPDHPRFLKTIRGVGYRLDV